MNKTILDAGKRVTEYLDRLVANEVVPGIQYIVLDANSTLLNYAGGIRDIQTKEKVTESTCFMSASSTKVVTAAAVMKLVEAGKVNLDEPLSKFYDQHPYGDKLCVRHLVNQSSGVPNPMPLSWLHTLDEHESYSESQALEEALKANPKLDFEPGQKYAYSNLSYWLLGKVVERASGMSYTDYVMTEVFAPLGISKEELHFEIEDVEGHARGHQSRYSLMTLVFWMLTKGSVWDQSAGSWARFQMLLMNGPAYGGVSGTATGYAKFLQDMLRDEPTLFSSETKAQFFEDQKDASGGAMPTTLGWHRGEVNKVVYYGKPGGGPGYHSNIRVYPDAGIATVFLANKTEVSETPINGFSDTLDREFITK